MADFSQMSDEQLAGCVSSAESGEAVAEMVSRYTGLVLALAGRSEEHTSNSSHRT